MQTTQHPLHPPSLPELSTTLLPALQENYTHASASVIQCPDLTLPPFHLAAPGLSGNESVADIGGQPHLFPRPLLGKRYSLLACAERMGLSSPEKGKGMLIGAGAGPFHVLGKNSESAPNLSWGRGVDGEAEGEVVNRTWYAMVEGFTEKDGKADVVCRPSPSTECALMMNLFGSAGDTGPVLKITARGRRGETKSFTECIRRALGESYGAERQVSLGGVFVIKKGRALYHVMPDFPPAEKLPFADRHELNRWLTYHEFPAPMVCLAVFHSADPEGLGLRMEHTHCFSAVEGRDAGGHYHGDILPGEGGAGEEEEEVEYEGYFNTAKTLYRIDRPGVALKGDLHD